MGGGIPVSAVTVMEKDIRDVIFAPVSSRLFEAGIIAERDGIVAGVSRLKKSLEDAGIQATLNFCDGAQIHNGEVVANLWGTAKQIAIVEEFAIGLLSKPSGIATAAHRAVQLAGADIRIVCGAWKKMPPEIKWIVREAVTCGKAAFRITDQPFLYLDKNFVRMLGGVKNTLQAVAGINDRLKVIQLKGEAAHIATQAVIAAQNGADIIMVDTGNLTSFEKTQEQLCAAGLRSKVLLAFAQGIQVEDIAKLTGKGIDILDIGVAILDAPLLDMRLEVRE